ncbi:integrase catalytic domain-containing protein [Trichonephila clavipes]|nr:integrase catalytic domain-containing protein [Trichonephila clavipes]
MNPSVRDLLRIVWKDKIDSPVKIFRLTTVTYGTKSAPYLATKSLKQLAIDDDDKYPLAAEVIMSDVYMDDLLTDALESINCLDIPRYCLQNKSIRTELHGFSDSSEKAYGAELYLRCINTSGEISVRLLSSISKHCTGLDQKPLAQVKTFVRNRVSILQELTESDFWKHVNSENNPVDILSRGISPDKIQHCELWWFGPPFLHQYKELEPYDITAVEGDDLFLQELKETWTFF